MRGLAITGAGTSGIGDGIIVRGNRNTIAGNLIGLVPGGAVAGNLGNGIRLDGAANTVGGPAVADTNVVSANGRDGVEATGAGNVVQGNRIGLAATAARARGNRSIGVELDGAGSRVVGNVIGANDIGIEVADGAFVQLRGNVVGTDRWHWDCLGNLRDASWSTPARGTRCCSAAPLPTTARTASRSRPTTGRCSRTSSARTSRRPASPCAAIGDGIAIFGDDAVVGRAGLGNTVVGNAGDGLVLFSGTTGHRVAGNAIGTDGHGRPGLGNAGNGVQLSSTATTVGGPDPGDANTTSANGGDGIAATGDGAVIEGNFVGSSPGGGAPLGNAGNGIAINADGVQVTHDLVAFNALAGIAVTDGTSNTLAGNSAFANGGLGIDLGPVGPTANDLFDVDTGANDLLNTPRVLTATAGTGTTDITFAIENGRRFTALQVEFFASDACPAAAGQRNADIPLGTALVSTDRLGRAAAEIVRRHAAGPGDHRDGDDRGHRRARAPRPDVRALGVPHRQVRRVRPRGVPPWTPGAGRRVTAIRRILR